MSPRDPNTDEPSFLVPKLPGMQLFALVGVALLVLTAISALIGALLSPPPEGQTDDPPGAAAPAPVPPPEAPPTSVP